MKRYLYAAAIALVLLSGCGNSETAAELAVPKETVIQTAPDTTLPVQTENTTDQTIEEEPPMETQSMLLTEPKDTDLVRIRDYIPDVVEDLKYATADNFTGAVIYDFQDAYLRYGSVKKLMAVQQELHTLGLGIKVWDGFRPVSAQFRLWEIFPDDTYVANPNVGYSNHSRGFAVDLTLVDAQGNELEMPTQFDDFSGKADRNYSDVSETARENSNLLESIMEKHGFKGYYGEWWHYNDSQRYEVETVFDPGLISSWRITGEEPAVMQDTPDHAGNSIASIGPGAIVTVMGYDGDYALINWQGQRGYVPCIQLYPV